MWMRLEREDRSSKALSVDAVDTKIRANVHEIMVFVT
jgi:hypothetical protein